MVLKWQIIRLQLKETFSISYGDYSFREALLVELSHANEKGYGECTAVDYYHINLNAFSGLLSNVQNQIERFPLQHPTDFYAMLCRLSLPDFLKSALDCAYWDLYGKLEKRTFAQLNAIACNTLPTSSITISIANVESQIAKMNTLDWPLFKVKCDGFAADGIRKLLDSGFSFSLDSNASFSQSDCQMLTQLEGIENVLYMEQPMPIGSDNFSTLSIDAKVIWMADEDAQHESDLVSLQHHYQAVNVKLMKCGGLTPALAMIKTAKAMGFKVMIGCMTESTVGISAGAALAPLCDFADLDGANLVTNTIANGSRIERGLICLSEKPGLGIELQ